MNLNAPAKYFELYRKEHNIDDVEHVTDGEVLVWLANMFNIEKKGPSMAEIQANSLRLLDEYFKNTPPEEIQALVDKVSGRVTSISKDQWWAHEVYCCKKHGCKLNSPDCPVEVGLIQQKHPCEHDNKLDPCFSTLEGRVIYLIEKAWLDPMSNHNACGYTPHGFVFTLEEAKTISGSGRLFTREDCWQIPEQGMQEFICTPLSEIDNPFNTY